MLNLKDVDVEQSLIFIKHSYDKVAFNNIGPNGP